MAELERVAVAPVSPNWSLFGTGGSFLPGSWLARFLPGKTDCSAPFQVLSYWKYTSNQ